MKDTEAQELVSELADSYPSRRVTPEQRERLAWGLRSYPLAAGALAIERWTKAEPMLPSVAQLRRAVEAIRRETAPTGELTPRMRMIVELRGLLEHPHLAHASHARAREDAADMVPPITDREWEDARQIANERYQRAQEERQAKKLPPLPPRHPESCPLPPEKSYAGAFPVPGEGAYCPPRQSARAHALVQDLLARVIHPVPPVLVPRDPGQEG